MRFLKFLDKWVGPFVLIPCRIIAFGGLVCGLLVYSPGYILDWISCYSDPGNVDLALQYWFVGVFPLLVSLAVFIPIEIIVKRHNAQKDSDQSDGSAAGQ